MAVAGVDGDVRGAHVPGAGNREQSERAGADHRDPGVRPGAGEAERVPGDGRRLDERGVAHVEPGRDLDEALGGGEEGSAMPPSAEMPSARWAWVGHRL